MSEPIEIDAADLFEFIRTPGPVVLFLSIHPAHAVNRALPRRLREERVGEVPFATTPLLDVVVSAVPALAFLQQGLRSCGVSTPVEALPGYYLFHDGRMIAWDSGLPTRADLPVIARGSLIGLLFFAFTRDLRVVRKALRAAAEEAMAGRMTDCFREAFARLHADASPSARPSPRDELAYSYRVLGVSPLAADAEIDAAWRALRSKLHPDRAAADPVEFARRSRLAMEINRARDVIREHRGHGRR